MPGDEKAVNYWNFLKAAMKFVLLTGVALGVVLAVLAVALGHAEFNITAELAREDALWLLIGTPIVLGVLALVVSPLSWLIGRAALRRGSV
jgi:uncharacterized membrane protein YdbT with pleckstrin-like domain